MPKIKLNMSKKDAGNGRRTMEAVLEEGSLCLYNMKRRLTQRRSVL